MRASRATSLHAVAALAVMVAAARGVSAQSLSLPYPYPANDTPLTLPSGTVVRTRKLIVFRGHNVSSLNVVIETPTPATDTARVASEAQAVANLHATFAQSNGLTRIMVSICRTQACLEMRELPAESFDFSQSADGSWIRDESMRSRP
jgi:hypothetical protein